MFDILHQIATTISLVLTVPALVLGTLVLILWYKGAMEGFYAKYKKSFHWFMMGVFISFLGGNIDNIYWYVAWFGDYVKDPFAKALFDGGVYSNIFARQTVDIIAAYCHIRSGVEFIVEREDVNLPPYLRTAKDLNKITLISVIAGFLVLWILIFIHRCLFSV